MFGKSVLSSNRADDVLTGLKSDLTGHLKG